MTINKKRTYRYAGIACVLLLLASCGVPNIVQKEANTETPESFKDSSLDTINSAKINWKEFFKDPNLTDLIDIALENNQELNITLQELQIVQNEVRVRKGEYLPFIGLKGGAELEKSGKYTRNGAVEENLELKEGVETPDPLPNYMVGAYATWEIDIWHKLRNAKKSAVIRYLSTVEGRNFMMTNLIKEVASSYYELLALDNQLMILQRNIKIQNNALRTVRLQKQSANATELAIKKFEAEVYGTQSLQYEIEQKITETENKINFLLGRYPQPIQRDVETFDHLIPQSIQAGLPAQILENRSDVKQAELDLEAAKLDVKVAKARFYPSLGISAGIGYQAFNAKYLFNTPQSLLYSIAGDLTAPLINRNAIKAIYSSANAKQLQAVYNYERSILKAYIEIANQLSNIENLEESYNLKNKEVDALTKSINISNDLFTSARADYMEVLLTQRDALESKFELVETKKEQMIALIKMYQALGGGWNKENIN